MRAQELAATRQSKLQRLQRLMDECNSYLATHPKAQVDTALRKVQDKAEKLKIHTWIDIQVKGRKLIIEIDEDKKTTPPI